MNFIRNDGNVTEEDDANWGVIEISKITNGIIGKLLDKLKKGLSDDFFISFQSLIKIGRKAEPMLQAIIDNNDNNLEFRNDLFHFALKLIQEDEIENPLVLQLYNPDFIARARAIMQIEDAGDLNYLKFILPLVEDPDDSVRWAAINFLINKGQLDKPIVFKKLKGQMRKESNSVILKRLTEILKK